MKKPWEAEHGKEYEVPAFVDYLVKLGILQDRSWHNDTVPRFSIVDPADDENSVELWVDHPLHSQRELQGEGPRFHITAADLLDESSTDELETAIETVFLYAEKHIEKFDMPDLEKIVSDWVKSTRR